MRCSVLMQPQAAEAEGCHPAHLFQLSAQRLRAFRREPIWALPARGRLRRDEPFAYQAPDRCVERTGTERHADRAFDVGHHRVPVLRAGGQAGQDQELGSDAGPNRGLRAILE